MESIPSSSFNDTLEKLKAEATAALAPLKALNDVSPLGQSKKPRKSIETEQDAYMRRLETFNKHRGSWIHLPPRISPIVLASHGWSVFNQTTVKCDQCKSYLNVKVSPTDLSELKFSVKYIASQLRPGHAERCFWYSKVISQLPDEDFILQEAYMAVKLALRKHKDDLFDYDTTYSREPILDEKMVEYLTSLLKENERACYLAFHAWLPNSNDKIFGECLKCRLCAAKFAIDPYVMDVPFNPVKFHERYCPVRVDLKAFQVNILVKNMEDIKSSSTIVENLRSIHDYLDHYKKDQVEQGDDDTTVKAPEDQIEP